MRLMPSVSRIANALRSRWCRSLVTSAAVLALAGCAAGNFGKIATASVTGETVRLEGFVHGGQQPITGATVQLYAVGTTTDQSAATPLIAPVVLTDASGAFSITGLYTCPSITSEVYLIAKGGNPGLAPGTNNTSSVLMSALGPCGNLNSSTHIVINEASTIGSIYPITPFMAGYLNVGSTSGNAATLAADFMQINQFINTDGGQSPGPTLPGGFTAPVANLYSLANSMAACVNSIGGVAGDGSPCGNFFLYAKPPAGPAPTNTTDAILSIANNPTQNVAAIFALAPASPPFQPTLTVAPADWTLKILPNLTLTTPSNLVGVGSTTTGTLTLGQAAPAGGLTVNMASSNAAAVTVVTPVNLGAGATSIPFSYTGVASGTSTLTASATGYYSGSTTLSATSSLISLGSVPTVAPGQSLDLPLSLGTPAPAGGVTINFTSANPGVATVTGSSFIPAGLKLPATNPQVTGVTVGVTQINAAATNFAPGARSVTVSVAASLPQTFSVPIGTPTNETLTISAPAPAGGITFNLSVDNPTIFTVPATVTVPQGAITSTIAIQGATAGTTTLRANSPNILEASSSVTVNGTINTSTSSLVVGKFLETAPYFYLPTTPPNPITATVTSSAPSVAVVSTSATTVGAATASFPSVTGTSALSFYVQGVSIGSATLTIAAPGYVNATIAVIVSPSGFVFNQNALSTTTFSPDSSLPILSVVLNASTSAVVAYEQIAPGLAVSVAVANSTPAIGTISNSPVPFAAADQSDNAIFHPLAAGTTNLTLTTPAGFSTPSSSQQVAATVTAPPIQSGSSSLTAGIGLQTSNYEYLTQPPPAPVNVTVTSSNPAVAVVSSSATVAGAASFNFPNVVTASAFSYYVQGVAVGSATVTISAPGYSPITVSVVVDPSGFVLSSPGSFSTTSLSPPSAIQVYPVILSPGSLTVLAGSQVSPQASGISVTLTSATPAVGTISGSPIVFHAGDTYNSGSFQPVSAGTSVLSIGTPAGFQTPAPASTQTVTATVTAPPINAGIATLLTGVKLSNSTYFYLSQPPTSPVTVTITSSNPSIATVSSSPTIAGTPSITFPNTVNASAMSFYAQGQAVGTVNFVVSAPGFSPVTVAVTVDPSGFVFTSSSTLGTTTFSPASAQSISPVVLSPGTFAVLAYAALAPGAGTTSLTVTSSATQVGTVTTPVNFNGGDTTQFSSFQPIAAGTSTLTLATPSGFSTPSTGTTIAVTVTAPPINASSTSVQTGVNLQVQPYVYLSQTPPSPVTVTITSGSTSIATLSTSATVNGGATVTFPGTATAGVLSFFVQGHAVGSTSLTVSAAGYANATINVVVTPSGFVLGTSNFSTTTFSSPTNIQISPAILTAGTFNFVGYAMLGPGINPQVPIVSSAPGVGTVTSPITVNPGDTSDYTAFQPVGAGTTNLTLGTPAGFSTPSSAASQQIAATVTAPPIAVGNSAISTGVGLQIATYTYLTVAPPSPVTVTLTSNSPGTFVLSKSPLVAGSGTITFAGINNASVLSFYVQGITANNSTITISAPGYASLTVPVASNPSSFVIVASNFSTTTFSPNTAVQISPVILNPGVLTVASYALLGPAASVQIALASGTPTVGTVATPITFNPGDSSQYASFKPVSPGSTLLSLTTPAGFTVPSQVSVQQVTATVTAPPIYTAAPNIVAGVSMQTLSYAYLSAAPPSAVTVSITMTDPTIATVSSDPTIAGTAGISFPGVTGTNALNFSIQGQKVGSTSLTISAPGFAPTTVTLTVNPSGFVFYPASINTTVSATDTSLTVLPVILNPGVLTINSYSLTSPNAGTISVPVGSTSPQIGSVSTTAAVFAGNMSSQTFTFHPIKSGSTNIVIVNQPAGFTASSQPSDLQVVATVQ